MELSMHILLSEVASCLREEIGYVVLSRDMFDNKLFLLDPSRSQKKRMPMLLNLFLFIVSLANAIATVRVINK
jgi:hypothetical protein